MAKIQKYNLLCLLLLKIQIGNNQIENRNSKIEKLKIMKIVSKRFAKKGRFEYNITG